MVAVSPPDSHNLTGEKMQSRKPEMKEVRKLEGGRVGVRKNHVIQRKWLQLDGRKYTNVYHSAVTKIFLPKE